MPVFGEPDHVGWRQGDQHLSAPQREQRSGRAGDQRQQQAFGNHLPQDPAAARAERHPDGHFAAACGRLAQQQRGGVGAGDQQHDTHHTPQQVKSQAHAAHELILQTQQGDASPLVALRVLLLEAGGNRRELRLRLFRRNTCVQPPNREETVVRAAGRTRLLGKPDIHRARELETLWQHAHDEARFDVHANRPLEHAGIATIAALPVRMADQRHPVAAARCGFFRSERATDDRLDSEDAEELAIDDGRSRILGGVARRRWKITASVRRHGLERRALRAPIPEVGDRDERIALARGEKSRGDGHDSIGAGIRQRLQEHGVHHAEDRRIGADPERHDDDGEHGKARTVSQRPSRIPQVAEKVADDVGTSHVRTPLIC